MQTLIEWLVRHRNIHNKKETVTSFGYGQVGESKARHHLAEQALRRDDEELTLGNQVVEVYGPSWDA